VLLGETKLLVPMAGLIDAAAEIQRLEKQRAKLESDLGKTRAKLDKPSFVDNAPAEVVDKERRRAEELGAAIANLEQQLERVRAFA
jgi:valyl-tRNA synthetase